LGVNLIYFCISFVLATMTHNSPFSLFTKTDLSIPSWQTLMHSVSIVIWRWVMSMAVFMVGMTYKACGSSEPHARHADSDSSKWYASHAGVWLIRMVHMSCGVAESSERNVIHYAKQRQVDWRIVCIPPVLDGWGCRGENGMIASTIFLIRVRWSMFRVISFLVGFGSFWSCGWNHSRKSTQRKLTTADVQAQLDFTIDFILLLHGGQGPHPPTYKHK